MLKNNFLKKFTQWEYWPAYMFYIPNVPYAIYLALKVKNITFFSVINPAIKSSGNGTESKFKTLQLIPKPYRPNSIFIPENRDFETVIKELHKKGLDFPIIVKPDIGFRGMLVEKIHSKKELLTYLNNYPIALILQEFVDLPNECGVFYHRIPGKKTGAINSLTFKSFLNVTGDGFSTLAALVSFDKRAQHYTRQLQKKHVEQWCKIPIKGEKIVLSYIGNHTRGTQFLNANHLIDKELVAVFDKIKDQIEGWNYGRLDVKYNTWEELKRGKHLKILEINGAVSEPTHIYDPYKNTYFEALQAIRLHWRFIYEIAKVNLAKGLQSKDSLEFWNEIKNLRSYIKKVKKLTKAQSQFI